VLGKDDAMRVRITLRQIITLGVGGVLLVLFLVWVVAPGGLPYFEDIWNQVGRPGLGVRAVAAGLFFLLIMALGAQRY